MEKLIDMYLKYVNDFITVERFAEWYGLEMEDANTVIDLGRKYHEMKTTRLQVL